MTSPPPIARTSTGVRLRLRVQPRASREEVAGVAGGVIRVGAANEALIRFLAVRLKVPRSAVVLVSGRSGRAKLVEVTGISAEETAERLRS